MREFIRPEGFPEDEWEKVPEQMKWWMTIIGEDFKELLLKMEEFHKAYPKYDDVLVIKSIVASVALMSMTANVDGLIATNMVAAKFAAGGVEKSMEDMRKRFIKTMSERN